MDLVPPDMDAGAPGLQLSGCRLEAHLGRGSMGAVWSARQSDGSLVVVKLLSPQHAADAAWRARFEAEARNAGRVVHPNVARVVAFELDGPCPHVVLEFVPGEDLAERLEAEGALPWREAARLARDVARGLAAAHAVGVIHCDVKPGNVRVTPQEQVKVLDFGLSLGPGQPVPGVLEVRGTPCYMAPEQWTGQALDTRCDAYGLGATLYHLVTGRPPVSGEHLAEVRRRSSPRELVPQLPQALERLILRLLARQPDQRPAAMTEVADELQSLLDPCPLPTAGAEPDS